MHHLSDEYGLQDGPEQPPRFDLPLQLENRGTSSQIHQQLLWKAQTIHKNSTAAKLRLAGMLEHAQKLEHCHSQYTVAVCNGCSKVQRFPNRCDTFFCAECQPRLSENRRRAVEWWTREISQPKHVVLTVVNLTDLTGAHIDEFRKMWHRLLRSKFAENWIGGFYNIEVTNEGRGWHLHLHALVDARWIDAFGLSAQWTKATNGLGRIVHVRDARGKNYLAEVTKYTVKGVQLAAWTPEQIATFVRAFEGKHCFCVFGSLFGKRTEFREWFKAIRDSKVRCSCGCNDARFYSECEFAMLDLKPEIETAPLPPPRESTLQDLMPFEFATVPPK